MAACASLSPVFLLMPLGGRGRRASRSHAVGAVTLSRCRQQESPGSVHTQHSPDSPYPRHAPSCARQPPPSFAQTPLPIPRPALHAGSTAPEPLDSNFSGEIASLRCICHPSSPGEATRIAKPSVAGALQLSWWWAGHASPLLSYF